MSTSNKTENKIENQIIANTQNSSNNSVKIDQPKVNSTSSVIPSKENKEKDKEKEGERDLLKEREEKLEKALEKYKPMRRGNYTVHILIEKITQLKKIGDENKKLLPMVTVTCFDKTLRTPKLENEVFEFDFEENMYFSAANKSPEELDSEKIIIKVINLMESNKKNYLGLYQFDLQYIYNNYADHALHNNWIALCNYENESIEGVNGYLRLSISVTHELDKKAPLAPKESALNLKNIMVPNSSSALKFQQLSFYIYSVSNVPEMDSNIGNDFKAFVERKNCASDTYVQLDFMDLKVQTKVQKMVAGEYSKFCEVLKIPIIEPRLSNKIMLQVFDSDTFGAHDLIGTLELNLDELLDDNYYFYSKSGKDLSHVNDNAAINKNHAYFLKNFNNLRKDDVRIITKANYDPNEKSLFDFENNLKNNFGFIKKKELFEMLSLKQHYDKIVTYPIYGSNPEFNGKEMGMLMNANSEIGQMFKGCLTMKIVKEIPEQKPKITSEPFLPLESENFCDLRSMWRISIEVYDLNLFREVNCEKIKIAFICGKEHLTIDKESNPKIRNKGLFNYYNDDVGKFVRHTLTINTLNDNINELPDLFVYVFESDKLISYQRLETKQFFHYEEFFILKLLPDPFRKKNESVCNAGILSLEIKLDHLFLSTEKYNSKGNLSNKNAVNSNKDNAANISPSANVKVKDNKIVSSNVKQELPKKIERKKSEDYDDLDLCCAGNPAINSSNNENKINIYNNNNAIDINNDAKSIAPFSRLRMNTRKSKYNIAFKLYQTKDLNIVDSDGGNDPFIEIWYGDICKKTTTFINTISPLTNFELDLNNPNVEPKYLPILHPQLLDTKTGEVLFAMNIFDQEIYKQMKNNNETNFDIMHQSSTNYCIEINAIGMRNLVPTGIVDIKKPFIVFDMDSVDVNKKANKPKLKKIKTINKEFGPNASINQIYRIEVDLPEKTRNIPNLRCEVNDTFLKIFDEILGFFEIDLRKTFEETEIQMRNSEEMLSQMVTKEKRRNEMKIKALQEMIEKMDDENNKYKAPEKKKEKDASLIVKENDSINKDTNAILLVKSANQKQTSSKIGSKEEDDLLTPLNPQRNIIIEENKSINLNRNFEAVESKREELKMNVKKSIIELNRTRTNIESSNKKQPIDYKKIKRGFKNLKKEHFEFLFEQFFSSQIKNVEDSRLLLNPEENNGIDILSKVCDKYELLFTKIMDSLDIMTFEPVTQEITYDPLKKENYCQTKLHLLDKYGKLNEEVFEIPLENFYKKIGHSKTSLDPNAKKHYRRFFDVPLEDVNLRTTADEEEYKDHLHFKIPITKNEMKILERNDFEAKIGEEFLFVLKMKNNENTEFKFKSPFKREFVLRGKSNLEKKKSYIFDSMRDPLKYLFVKDKDLLKPINFEQVYKSQNSQFDNEREKDAIKKKLSKGEFLYLARVYNKELFERNVKILEEICKMKEERRKIKELKKQIREKKLTPEQSIKLSSTFTNNPNLKNTNNNNPDYSNFLNDSISSLMSESSFKNEIFSINQQTAELKNRSTKTFDFSLINSLLKEVPRDFNKIVSHESVSKQLLNKTEVIVRVYILQLSELANRDMFIGDKSDPYVRVSLGGKVYDEKEKHIDDSSFVNWFKYYDFNATLPGTGKLQIEVMDYDPLFSDDYIGKTEIDIESRFFDPNWQALAEKPIETRPLSCDEYFDSQGFVSLWVDIFDKKDDLKRNNPVFIKPKPASEFEMRLIVWESEGLQNKDIYSSDVFYTLNLDEQSQSTDVHFNSFNGESSFHWRIKMPLVYDENGNFESGNLKGNVKNQSKEKILNVLAYDYDLFTKNDFIAQRSLNVTKLVKECDKYEIPVKLDKSYFEEWKKNDFMDDEVKEAISFEDEDSSKFWLNLKHGDNKKYVKDANRDDPDGPAKKQGRVLISMEIFPIKLAAENPVGKGREEPNVNPYLPPPVGRMKLSWNPYSLMCQCVPPRLRKKIALTVCCFLCVAYLVFVIPYIILHLSGELANPFNYISKTSK